MILIIYKSKNKIVFFCIISVCWCVNKQETLIILMNNLFSRILGIIYWVFFMNWIIFNYKTGPGNMYRMAFVLFSWGWFQIFVHKPRRYNIMMMILLLIGIISWVPSISAGWWCCSFLLSSAFRPRLQLSVRSQNLRWCPHREAESLKQVKRRRWATWAVQWLEATVLLQPLDSYTGNNCSTVNNGKSPSDWQLERSALQSQHVHEAACLDLKVRELVMFAPSMLTNVATMIWKLQSSPCWTVGGGALHHHPESPSSSFKCPVSADILDYQGLEVGLRGMLNRLTPG